MEPKFKIYHNDDQLSEAVDKLRNDGIPDDDIYILSIDNDHDRRARKETDANKIGAKVTGVSTALKNVFKGKGDTIRSKLNEIGFDKSKSEQLKVELDKGKTLLVVTNQESIDI
ncbi:general stress protein [Oceanobacillus picturae]|jgi:Heat induced stress protein YflT|uniref:general stress protein n=1 Tax=Oceanobacillus picturae TaxID=171693 RepID=UPI000E676D72|nr:general stress protein [Oceanobacillus picturae]RIU94938.1 general stress protein [Oceanobacillus picturae]